MKKIFYLLLVLPLIMVSCKDDDELPDVKFNVEISGGKNVNGVIYVVKGDTLTVEKVEIASHNSKGAAMGEVSYFWDGMFLLTNPFPPYKINIATDEMIMPNHILEFNCPLYVVDSPILTAYFRYPVKLVDVPDSIPQEPAQPITSGFNVTNK